MIGSSNVGVCDRFCLKFVPSLLHSEDSSVLTVSAVPALTDLCEHSVTHPSQFLPVLLLFKLPGSWRNCPLMRRSGTGVFKLIRKVKPRSVGGGGSLESLRSRGPKAGQTEVSLSLPTGRAEVISNHQSACGSPCEILILFLRNKINLHSDTRPCVKVSLVHFGLWIANLACVKYLMSGCFQFKMHILKTWALYHPVGKVRSVFCVQYLPVPDSKCPPIGTF